MAKKFYTKKYKAPRAQKDPYKIRAYRDGKFVKTGYFAHRADAINATTQMQGSGYIRCNSAASARKKAKSYVAYQLNKSTNRYKVMGMV